MAQYYDPSDHPAFCLDFAKSEWATGDSSESYRANNSLSASFLKDVIDMSPGDAERNASKRDAGTPASKIQSLMRCLELTPDEEGNLTYPEFMHTAQGKIIVTEDEWNVAKRMADSVKGHLPPLEPCRKTYYKFHLEAVLYAEAIIPSGPFEGFNIPLKGVLDGLHLCSEKGDVRIYEIRKVASIGGIAQLRDRGWSIQSALYFDMAKACFNRPIESVVLCVSEKSPHGVGKFIVSPEMLSEGRRLYSEAISKWLWYVHKGPR